jgi:hypothetical protein
VPLACDVQAERSPGVWVGVSGREAWGVREARGLWLQGLRLGAGC